MQPTKTRRIRFEPLEDRSLLSVISAHPDLKIGLGVSEPLWFEAPAGGSATGSPFEWQTIDWSYESSDRVNGHLSLAGALLGADQLGGFDFTRLEVPGWGSTNEIGRAQLPVYRGSLIVPNGVDVTAAYQIESTASLSLGRPVCPVQPPESEDGQTATYPGIVFDAAYYDGSSALSTTIVEVSAPAIVRGTSVVFVSISPFLYNPASGELDVVTELAFSLDFSPWADAGETMGTDTGEPTGGVLSPPSTGDGADVVDPDYLIITADAFYEEVLPLAQWKQRKGFQTQVVRLSEVGATATAVKNFISNTYHTGTPTSYVLLVGDYNDVPSTSMGSYLSDHAYACVDGSDYFADLTIGRLSVHTEAEATIVVNKILAYDRNPDMGDWYDDVLSAGYLQGPPEADRWFMETTMHVAQYLAGEQGLNVHYALTTDSLGYSDYYYRQTSYPHRLQVVSRYEPFATSTTPPYPVPNWIEAMFVSRSASTTQVSNAVNAGVGLVQHRDHGGETGWGDPPFYVSNVNALTNGAKTPVVFSTNCLTGKFNYSGGNCFAEAMQKHANGGAVGVMASTEVSYSGYNDLLVHGIYTCFWPDYDPTHTVNPYSRSMRPAEAMNFGKYYMYGYEGASSTTQIEFYEFHWFGDPEMMLRTATPAVLSVAHPTAVPFGAPMNVTVTVNAGGMPQASARVCISCDGSSDYWVGTTNAAGSVTFAGLAASELGDYHVVVTGYNLQPYEGVIHAVVEGPFAQLSHPAPAGAVNTDLGYVDIEWLDFAGSGLNLATIDANDISIPGVVIQAPIHQAGNVWRYAYSGSLTPGPVQVSVIADQVQDNEGKWNLAQASSFIYDAAAPTGTLAAPVVGSTIYADPGYLDVRWTDAGHAGVSLSTIDANDITISGVTVAGPPSDRGGGVWRYNYTGSLAPGVVTVTFVAGEVLDLAGNAAAGHTESFTYAPLQISTPATLPAAYLSLPYNTTLNASGGVAPYQWAAATGSSILITECSDDTPDYVEIQNISGVTVNTAGWVVALNDAVAPNINTVHTVLWQLPNSMAPGQILYREDEVGSAYYFGSNIWWGSATRKGWAMIVDSVGNVVDFVVWGYSAAEIASMNVTVNGHVITIGSQWTGSGVSYIDTPNSLQRIGNSDRNGPNDFVWQPVSKGTWNAGLTVPFFGGSPSLPPGLSLDTATGVISGVPTQSGNFTFTVGVTDSHIPAYRVAREFYLNVSDLPPVTILLPAAASEGDGLLANQGTVSIPSALGADLVVSLLSNDTSEVAVPATVTIAAGTTSKTFDLLIGDDARVDGSRTVAVSGTATGYAPGQRTMVVHDNEAVTLAVALPASATEGAGVLVGKGVVSIDRLADVDVVVALASDNPSEASVPATATILAGTMSRTFDITIKDDAKIDDTQTVWITASVQNWTAGSARIDVLDNETRNLTVAVPAKIWEGQNPVIGGGTVSISGTLPMDLLVSLLSSDGSELLLPENVVIPAGELSATFDVIPMNDADYDGVQAVTVTAGAVAFNSGAATIEVGDDDVHHFGVGNIVGPKTAGVPFGVTLTAQDVNDSTITVFTKTAQLAAAGSAGPVPLSPTTTTSFASGVWTGSVAVNAVDTNVVLTVSDGAGHTGTSNAFNVTHGSVTQLQWNTIASPQTVNVPFPVTITAKDANGYTATSFTGPVNLSGMIAGGAPVTVGTGTSSWNYPLRTFWHDARTQVIYRANELGGAGPITSLALDVTTLPGQTLNSWTIRMKHTPLSSYTTYAWEGSGWTTVYQNNQPISSTGWVTFTFATPFDYDGTSNLMVDFSFNNTYYTSDGASRCTSTGQTRSLYYYTDSGYGNPLTWSGTSSPSPLASWNVPNIRLGRPYSPISVTPTTSGGFVNGVWTGQVTVNQAATGMYLYADGGSGRFGTSNTFNVVNDGIAPRVTNVLVSGSGWSSDFTSYLAALNGRNANGYSIPTGDTQLAPLPWAGIDQLKIVFSENVATDKDDLTLSGVNTSTYDLSGATFSYDPNTFTSTWTFPAAIGADKLMIRLNADGDEPVCDMAGNRLDGEWTNPPSTTPPPSTYPSGNGTAGGDFQFRFNVLPGDANQDGQVNAVDLARERAAGGTVPGNPAYNIFCDIDADARIIGADTQRVRYAAGSALPEAELTPIEPLVEFVQVFLGDVPAPDGEMPAPPMRIEVTDETAAAPSQVSSIGEATIGEPTTGEPTIGKPTIGEVTIGEVTTGEVTTGEVTIGEVTQREVTSCEPTTGEAAAGEITIDEVTASEVTMTDDIPVSTAALAESAIAVDRRPVWGSDKAIAAAAQTTASWAPASLVTIREFEEATEPVAAPLHVTRPASGLTWAKVDQAWAGLLATAERPDAAWAGLVDSIMDQEAHDDWRLQTLWELGLRSRPLRPKLRRL